MSPQDSIYSFGDFALDADQKVLFRDGKPVHLTPKASHLLCVLVEYHGRIVEKEILLKEVWPDSFVEESNLTFNIRQIRKILGDSKERPQFVETVPRRGYRFIAVVHTGIDVPESLISTPKKPIWLRSRVWVPVLLILFFAVASIGWIWLLQPGIGDSGSRDGERITTSGKVTIAAITADGRTLVFAQKDGVGESLWKRDIATGQETKVLDSAPVEFVGLSISPASDYIYYSVFAKNAVASHFSRVPIGGGQPELFPEIASDVSVSFSPDGSRFAYTESHSGMGETLLRVANVDGTSPQTLLAFRNGQRALPVFRKNPVAWAADGSTIACAIQEEGDSYSPFKILLVNPNDGTEQGLLARRWTYIESIVWRDNDTLAITDLDPSVPGRQIWLVPRDGSEPEKIKRNLVKYEWLAVAKGNLFGVETNTYSSIVTADFDEVQGIAHTKQIFNESGTIESIEWSDDGAIYYSSWASGANEIWRITPNGTGAEQITTDSRLTLGFTISPTDGSLVFAASRDGSSSLFLADPNGSVLRRLTDGINDSFPQFMPDGNEVIFQKGSMIKPTIWRVSIDGNTSATPATGYLAKRPSISPDGKRIAYQFMDHTGVERVWRLAIIDSRDGTLLNRPFLPTHITNRAVAWRPGDDTLTLVATTGENSGFVFLSSTNNSYRVYENVTNDKISTLDWSPDGRRLAFAVLHEERDVVEIKTNGD